MDVETTINSLVQRLGHISIESKTEILNELKTAIATLPSNDLKRIVTSISITSIFNCLNTQDKSQQQICGEILDKMLTNLTVPAVLENFHSQLLTWLHLPDETLKALCLHQLSRLSKEQPSEFSHYKELVEAIVDEVGADSLNIGPAATSILIQIGQDSNGLLLLYSETILNKFAFVMRKNDVTRFRIYQIVIDLSKAYPSALEASVATGLIQQIVNEVQSEDILVQLNAIEMVSDLALSPHGLIFLDQQGVLSRLEEMMVGLNNNPMMGLLLPGFIKFFGSIAKNEPKEVLSKFDSFVRMVLSSIDGNDPTLKAVSLDTVGFIALKPEGKLALEKIGNPMTECISSIGSLLKTGTSDLKVRALHALANLVYLKVEDQTVELLSLTEKWFKSCTSDSFKTVWSLSQQPFLDHRLPALRLLQNLAMLPWGQSLMNNAAGFKEYALDRATENSKEGKEEKFYLIDILAHSPTTVENFGRPYQLKLIEYYKQGPFFVFAQSEVAMEGE
ncbi:26S proteasome non-ATPase regulatory subunit 5-like [Biomphalaria glabrata]|uniref:26S proteasome non-ATPase regulatory subunit 5 n=1 Tax=Biomphalaria glabrata TaxID=6526 RepID=A0A9W3BED6_BIOGL|nr:26S proteasome non-ATPase regulatory subunit 5-like [Biomphalaria glabrata]